MLFEGINRIYRDYGVFDYPRSGGSRHNGMDIDGVNSFVIRIVSREMRKSIPLYS